MWLALLSLISVHVGMCYAIVVIVVCIVLMDVLLFSVVCCDCVVCVCCCDDCVLMLIECDDCDVVVNTLIVVDVMIVVIGYGLCDDDADSWVVGLL